MINEKRCLKCVQLFSFFSFVARGNRKNLEMTFSFSFLILSQIWRFLVEYSPANIGTRRWKYDVLSYFEVENRTLEIYFETDEEFQGNITRRKWMPGLGHGERPLNTSFHFEIIFLRQEPAGEILVQKTRKN